MWEKIKKVLKYIAIPFIILISFFTGSTFARKKDNTKEIKKTSKDIKNLEKQTADLSKELNEKEKNLSDSLDKSTNLLDDIKKSKEFRDKQAEKFFK